jgi:glycosyltransferase involved in cell wall biosynthesis
MKSIKVALICPFPIRTYFEGFLEFISKPSVEHPAPWITNLVKLLQKDENIELHVVSINPHLKKDERFQKDNVYFHLLKGCRYSLQVLTLYSIDIHKLIQEINFISPDVVEAFGTEGPYGFAGAFSKYPCIIYMQGIIDKLFRNAFIYGSLIKKIQYSITWMLERIAVKKCKIFVAENMFSGEFVKSLNNSAKVFEIPNLINPRFSKIVQTYKNDCSQFLFIGSVDERKGALTLLNAFISVHRFFPESHLCYIGPKHSVEIQNMERMIAENYLDGSVELPGVLPQNQIAEIFRQGGILVHPSKMDSSPNSVYEAMSAGIPVIASDVGGIPFMIKNNETGLLVPPSDPVSLSEKMLYLLANPSEQKRLGLAAQESTRYKLDHERIAAKILSVYSEMLGENT